MPTETELSAIPFQSGRAQLQVFQDTTHLIAYGINAQWDYDGHRRDLHIWNTAFGFEPAADKEYSGNKHRKAWYYLNAWIFAAVPICGKIGRCTSPYSVLWPPTPAGTTGPPIS